jgi:hypothetical protein
MTSGLLARVGGGPIEEASECLSEVQRTAVGVELRSVAPANHPVVIAAVDVRVAKGPGRQAATFQVNFQGPASGLERRYLHAVGVLPLAVALRQVPAL